MKIKKIVLSFVFMLLVSWHQGASASAEVVAEDLGDLEDELDRVAGLFVADVDYEHSEFEDLSGRGEEDPDSFEIMFNIFMILAQYRHDAVKAQARMLSEFKVNVDAKAVYQASDLTEMEDRQGVTAFNDEMKFDTLRLILKGFHDNHDGVQKKFTAASAKHIDLKTKSLKRQHSNAAKKLATAKGGYEKINPLYPEMPEDIHVAIVSAMDLGGLKDEVPNFVEAVNTYRTGLIAAKSWQTKFTQSHKKHATYVKEWTTIVAALETLREENDENPHLPVGDIEELENLDGLGGLEEIQGVLGNIEAVIKGLRPRLAKAKKWKAPAVELVAEAEDEGEEDEEIPLVLEAEDEGSGDEGEG